MTPAIAPGVATATEAGECDRAAIASGVESFRLMLNAGTAAASYILREYADRLASGVAVFAGGGNNGGDAYIVAAQLHRAGVRVTVHAAREPRTSDSRRAEALFRELVESDTPGRVGGDPRSTLLPKGDEGVVVDGLLGTGHHGELRGPIADAGRMVSDMRHRGAAVVALDMPTGVSADDGSMARGSVKADVTITFGTIKRGALLARSETGRIVLARIGVEREVARHGGLWRLAASHWLGSRVGEDPWNSWKTRRGVVGIVGGREGMAGAAVLAATGALRAGAGLVYAWVAEASRAVLQSAVPQAVVNADDASFNAAERCDAVVVGPGLGTTPEAWQEVTRWLRSGSHLVIDADALNSIAAYAKGSGVSPAQLLAVHRMGEHPIGRHPEGGRTTDTQPSIAQPTGRRSIVCTPHLGEFERLTGCAPGSSLAERVREASRFSAESGCTLVLKGTPTVICEAGSVPVVVARGTPALATGGSGDLLGGMIATLLALGRGDARMEAATRSIAPDGKGEATDREVPISRTVEAAATAVWLHGRAAELATASRGTTRGVSLDEIAYQVPAAWAHLERRRRNPAVVQSDDVVTELPDVNDIVGFGSRDVG